MEFKEIITLSIFGGVVLLVIGMVIYAEYLVHSADKETREFIARGRMKVTQYEEATGKTL